MARITQLVALVAAAIQGAEAAVSFAIPSKAGTGGYLYAPLDSAPLGISFEFFAFPSYFTNVTATNQCLSNWKNLTGTWPPVRIGGTTQDRALYDASTSAYVVYSVAKPADAPSTLTFGSKFMTLAGTYPGTVVVGLNRGKNNIDNTIAAAKVAVSQVKNLLAIELGNEPECRSRIVDHQPEPNPKLNFLCRLHQRRPAHRFRNLECRNGRRLPSQLEHPRRQRAGQDQHHPSGQLEPGAPGMGRGPAHRKGKRHVQALRPPLRPPQLPGRQHRETADPLPDSVQRPHPF